MMRSHSGRPGARHGTVTGGTAALPLAPVAADRPRIAAVDLARGIAIVAMVGYHATWDMGPQFHGLIAIDAATDPALRVVSKLIAGTFLFLVGVSLVLAHHRAVRWPAFLRRLGIIVAAAIAVTVVTYLVDPGGFAYFGILHGIAVCSIAALPFLRAPLWLTTVGAMVAFAAPTLFAAEWFNAWPLYWLGLSTDVPWSVDYVPLFPWLGTTLLGVLFGRLALAAGLDRRWSAWRPRGWLPRGLIVAGRWSLAIYLVHQPLLLGLLWLAARGAGRA